MPPNTPSAPSTPSALDRWIGSPHGIWAFCALYFASYVPYVWLTKASSSGHMGVAAPLTGLAILPLSNLAAVAVMLGFAVVSGWWRHANHREIGRLSVPWPRRYTALSGLCTAVILTSVTLAYALDVSIVLMMLCMRGGTLIIAPINDWASGRRVHAASWLALTLSLSALAVATGGAVGARWSAPATLCLAAYLGGYFVRFRLMSKLAKATDPDVNKRYFIEEQLVAAPAALALTLVAVLIAPWADVAALDEIRGGALALWSWPTVAIIALIGACSQGTGIFGTLILLDPKENTFAASISRALSTLAGVAAAVLLAFIYDDVGWPATSELVGVALMLAAVATLAWRSRRA